NEARLADSGLVNFSDQEASWFQDVHRVPLGCTVELQPGRPRCLNRYYDPLAIEPVPTGGDAEVFERVGELLDQAVRACLSGHHKPGATVSGGLDSPQIAVRALNALPAGQKLPTFTFHPEQGYDGVVQAGMIGDERPIVKAFAAGHPRIEPHFTANEGYEHDYRWNDFFHLMGGAPSGLCNMYVFHGLFAGAAREGCDLLLVSDWGNNAFSDKGYWGFVEYFLTGRWRQLWLALRKFPIQERSMLWRFVAQSLLPLLPNRLWRQARKLVFRDEQSMLDVMQPFSPAYRAASGADERLKRSGLVFERYQPWSARHARQLLLQNDDGEAAEVYQAFEQMYGVPQRDPMAYRPLVEYCWGLPTRMFMRDGQMRWLAKQMARGIMPEEQRANRLNGRWDADWHLRIGRRRKDLVAEFDRLAANERIAAMLDLPRLRAAIHDWPERTETDFRKYAAREFTIPRALLTARFVNYVEGRNEQ
ncbi:MAG TPA: asparagine synthase C-terminal domain-containing protein, partial [Sphingomicrobium sp.]|nr:asparagine synthase C-terminal domain-containing protein [Sphingomicrobium sp.]